MEKTRKEGTGMEKRDHKKSVLKRIIGFSIMVALIAGTIPSIAVAEDVQVSKAEDGVNLVVSEETGETLESQLVSQNDEKRVIAERIPISRFITSNQIETENQAFLMNMSTGELLAGANLDQKISAFDVLKPMLVQVFLWESNLEDVVTVKEASLNKVSEDANIFGLRKGDQITVKNLLSIYLLSDAQDCFRVLIDHVSNSDLKMLSLLNSTAFTLSLTDTSFANIYGKSQEGQGSSAYDAYSLYRNLMQNDWYMELISSNPIKVTYRNSKNKRITQTVDNLNASWCQSVNVLGDYRYFAQISMRGDNDKDSQFVIFTDKNDQYYLSYLGNVNSLRNISSESGRLIYTLSGYTFYDSEILVTPTPTPTPQPTATPTPKPTATPTPSPSPTPLPTPTVGKSGLPITSNNARYQYIMGTDYKAYTMSNRPAGYRTSTEAIKNMTSVTLPVWKMTSSGGKYSSTMTIMIHKKLAKSVKEIFQEIYDLDMKFPIKTLVGYGYRKVGGVGLVNSTLMSAHAFGAAIDINPGDYDNDYYLGKGNDLRNKDNPYCIPDEVIDIFASHGWFWGGNFEICADTMHFQYLGLEFLTYQGKDNFRKLTYASDNLMTGADVKNLQQRLNKLGYKVKVTGTYNKASAVAIKKYQKASGLPVTGVVDYDTWETIINATHYMSYVF